MTKLKKFLTGFAAIAILHASGSAFAATVESALLNGINVPSVQDGSQADPFDLGALTAVPFYKTLAVTIAGTANESFEHYVNFTAPNTADAVSFAFTLNLGSGGTFINNFLVEVWNDVHPNGSQLLASFAGDNLEHVFNLLPDSGGQYHLDISGNLGPAASQGQYSISLATPVPEPEIYAMMAAGLGLMGFVARRRKLHSDAVI